ncbi:MAG: ROK family protein [Coriobacteriaceae bacterium]|nr:ROK family protein [Coriobacteriaceae bacterium]
MHTDASSLIVAIDVGGSKYITGVCTQDGTKLFSTRHEWKSTKQQDIVPQLVSSVRDDLQRHPETVHDIIAGGITIPGFTNPTSGLWVDSDNPVVRNLDVCAELSQALNIPFFGDNDCNACALAESMFGAGKNLKDFFYVTISSGIGGGTFIKNNLYYGSHLLSGEIGLSAISSVARPDISGNAYGRLEAYCSTKGMVRTYEELGGIVPSGDFGALEISQRADAGDCAAHETFRREGIYLGKALAQAAIILGPQRIVLGGGVALLYDYYRAPLESEMQKIPVYLAHPDVVSTPLGYESAFLGAAACARRGIQLHEAEKCINTQEKIKLHVSRLKGKTQISLRSASSEQLLPTGAGYIGQISIDSGLDPQGDCLDSLAKSSPKNYYANLGKLLATASTLLDPACIVLHDELTQADPLAKGLMADCFWDNFFISRAQRNNFILWDEQH